MIHGKAFIKRILKPALTAACAALTMAAICIVPGIGKTYAQHYSAGARNEFSNNYEEPATDIINPLTPEEPSANRTGPAAGPFQPSGGPPNTGGPPDTGGPPVNGNPYPPLAGPFNPEEAPKTGDFTQPAVLLSGLALGLCRLRSAIFSRHWKGGRPQ